MDWNKLKAEYIAGGTSYRKLAEKYGIDRNKLQKRATAEHWPELKSRAKAKTESKIVDKISKDAAHRATKIVYVADKLLDKISEIIDIAACDTQSIKHLTSALKDLKEIKGYMSELDMQEQQARIDKLRKEAAGGDTANEIEIVFNAGPDEWNE